MLSEDEARAAELQERYDWDGATRALQRAAAAYRSQGRSLDEARILTSLGYVARRSGHLVAAEEHFLQALDWAHRQGALSWELRAATSLARLRHQQDRTAEARRFLAPVYDRFTEGFGTADLKAAKALLNGCG